MGCPTVGTRWNIRRFTRMRIPFALALLHIAVVNALCASEAAADKNVRTQDILLWPGQAKDVEIPLGPYPVRTQIARIGRSCNCLDVGKAPDFIEPNKRLTLPMSVHAENIPGERDVKVSILMKSDQQTTDEIFVFNLITKDFLSRNDGTWKPADAGKVALKDRSPLHATLRFSKNESPVRWEGTSVSIKNDSFGLWECGITENSEGVISVGITFTREDDITSGEANARLIFSFVNKDGTPSDYHPSLLAKARVEGSVRSIPPVLFAGAIPVDESRNLAFDLLADSLEGRIRTSNDTRLKVVGNPSRKGSYVATVIGTPPVGMLHDWIEIEASSGEKLRIPVIGKIAAPVPEN